MKSRFLSLRECVLLGAPLFIVVLVGAFLTERQSERLEQQRRIESRPLRLNVWNMRAMRNILEAKKVGYNFSIRVDARVEGALPDEWPPQKVWLLRLKTAQVSVGSFKQPSRLRNTINAIPSSPSNIVPHANVLAISDIPKLTRELELRVHCEAPPSNATLSIELEAVGYDIRTRKFVGPTVVAPTEKLELRPFDVNNDAANNWKNQGFG